MGIREEGPAWRAGGGGSRRARKALRPLWRALPFHARHRISRALQPARWSCLLRRSDHRRRLQEVLERHRGLPVVVQVPHQEWNDLFQRPQQLARAFADRGALTLYVTPGIRRDGVPGPVEVGPRLWVLNVAEGALAAAAGAVAILSWLPSRTLLSTLRPRKLVYDHMDDLAIFYGGARRIRRDHGELLRRADLVACSARALADEARGMGVEPLLLPNGVDPVRFAPTGRVPPDLAPVLARGRPVIGYHGTLARWFDYGLLLAAARARPGWEFVLVGPADFDDAWDREALARQPNIHWLGPKAHEELPDYLAGFDVSMIPFRAGPSPGPAPHQALRVPGRREAGGVRGARGVPLRARRRGGRRGGLVHRRAGGRARRRARPGGGGGAPRRGGAEHLGEPRRRPVGPAPRRATPARGALRGAAPGGAGRRGRTAVSPAPVGVDGRFLLGIGGRPTGVQRVAWNWLLASARAAPEGRRFLVATARAPGNGPALDALAALPNVDLLLSPAPRGRVPAHLWEQARLPGILRRGGARTLLALANTMPVRPRLRSVLAVMDVSFLEPAAWFSASFRSWYRLLVPACLRRADRVVTISAFSRDEILRKVRRLDPARVEVIHPGVDHAPWPAGARDAEAEARTGPGPGSGSGPPRGAAPQVPPGPYVLCVGTLEPRKNLPLLLEAWRLLRARAPGLPHALVLAGGCGEVFARSDVGAGDGVRLAGYLPEDGLRALYRGADLFVYPSLYEGFGLPPLEAMALGVPAAVASAGALPEAVGDGAALFDPRSAEGLASLLARLLADRGEREALRERGLRRAAELRWETGGRRLNQLLDELERDEATPRG